MKMLELFSGTGVMSDAFERHGFDVTRLDKDERFDAIHEDAYLYLGEHGDEFEVIWAAPDCRSYSIACHNHRMEYGSSAPKSEYASYCDSKNSWLFDELAKLAESGAVVFVENPMGHMRKMPWSNALTRYTTTLCRYGHPYRKATDIWTNIDLGDLLPPCKPGSKCHRGNFNENGASGGNSFLHGAERAAYPPFLAEYIVKKVLADGRVFR